MHKECTAYECICSCLVNGWTNNAFTSNALRERSSKSSIPFVRSIERNFSFNTQMMFFVCFSILWKEQYGVSVSLENSTTYTVLCVTHWLSVGLLCLNTLKKLENWSGVTDASHTDRQQNKVLLSLSKV